MNLIVIARALSTVLLAIAGAAAAFAVMTAASGGEATSRFVLTAVLGGFIGVAFRLAALGRTNAGGPRDALVFAILAWVIGPALAAIPFMGADASGGYGRAFVDAVSAATTTGFTPAFTSAGAGAELVYWWSALQWAGGYASIVSALIILPALNLSGPGVHRSPLFTLEPERIFDRFARVGAAAMALYAGVTLLVALAIAATGAAAGDALCLAFAAVSTGGLLLPNGSMSAAGLGGGAILVAGVGLAFGAFNFALHWDVLRGRGGRASYFGDPESRAIAIFVAIVFVVIIFSGGALAGGAGRAFVEGLSLVSTAVWETGAPGAAALAPPVIMAVIIIGGSPTSTAGGVKLLRLILLLRHAGSELRRLAHPSSVAEVRFRGRALGQRHVMSLLVYAIGYAVAIAGLAGALAASGASLPTALAGAAAAVSNAGPALDLAVAGEVARQVPAGAAGLVRSEALLASGPASAALCLGMIVGRLEILAALAIFSPGFWRR